ncbi:hypothetical protein FB470_001930 [Amycolatopsis thermophila]|uniref:Uncharacterized protein n=1 Tax=Amycolatopsis thermophila TaxID=206084 RepID=A0ABU0ERL9_9PSEU|nr:hypothetical protein [Amycolatopsis thermophila]
MILERTVDPGLLVAALVAAAVLAVLAAAGLMLWKDR